MPSLPMRFASFHACDSVNVSPGFLYFSAYWRSLETRLPRCGSSKTELRAFYGAIKDILGGAKFEAFSRQV